MRPPRRPSNAQSLESGEECADALVRVRHVDLHRSARRSSIARVERVEQELVLAVRACVPQGRVGQRHERVIQNESEPLEAFGEVTVPCRPAQRQVELSVVLHELGVVLGGSCRPACSLHGRQVGLSPRSSSGSRGCRL